MSPETPRSERSQPVSRKRGRLKVFLGMSPGVGKTYEMLRAARRRKAEGGDVVGRRSGGKVGHFDRRAGGEGDEYTLENTVASRGAAPIGGG